MLSTGPVSSAPVASIGITGTLYTSNLSGGLSFTGSQTRVKGLAYVRALAAAGLSFTGSHTPIKFHWNPTALSGGLSFSGSSRKAVRKVITGGSSFSGSVRKAITKIPFTGTHSFIGSVRRAIVTTVLAAAILSFTGIRKTIRLKAFTAALSFVGTGTRIKANVMQFYASLPFNGASVGGLYPSSTIYPSPSLYPTAFVATSILAKQVGRVISGGAGFSGLVGRGRSKLLAASLTPVGAFIKRIGRPQTATLNFVGRFGRIFPYALTAALGFLGIHVPQTKKTVFPPTATITMSAQPGFITIPTITSVVIEDPERVSFDA